MVRRKEDLRIRGFRLQCHEVVLRLVEEMNHSDLVCPLGSGGKKNLKHGVLPGFRREPRTRPIPLLDGRIIS